MREGAAPSRHRLCRAEDCPKDGMKAFEAEGGLRVLVARSGDRYYGYQAMCPHMDVPLEDGFYDGAVITCHQHLWQWDARTGEPMGLAEAPLQRFALEAADGWLYLVPSSPLRQAELFDGVADSTLEAIARLGRSEVFDAGRVIYRPGDPADDLCVLESGRVQFSIGSERRESPAGFSLRTGEVFGWAALLEDQPHRIATATALERSAVLFVNGREALKILEGDPAAGYLVMRRLATLITRQLTPEGGR
jgi:toluene monooxygenase system ferredoxin subunit